MARTHAWTGAAAGSALAWGLGLGPVATATAVATCAGSALLPDLDHRNSTATRCCGPISQMFAALVGWLAGGHRKATHSVPGDLMFAGVIVYGMWSRQGALGQVRAHFGPGHAPLGGSPMAWAGLVGTLILAWVLVVVFAGLVRVTIGYPRGWLDDLLPIPATGAVLLFGGSLGWLPVAVLVGCLIHLVGDCLTPEGCPLLWPLSDRRFSLDLFTTNRWPEHFIVFPATVLATGLLLAGHGGLL